MDAFNLGDLCCFDHKVMIDLCHKAQAKGKKKPVSYGVTYERNISR